MNTKLSKHARFAPSSAERWSYCTKSLDLHESQPSSVYAKEGEICHEIAANYLKPRIRNPKINPKPPEKYVGETIKNVLITEELMDAVKEYIDIVLMASIYYGKTTTLIEKTFYYGGKDSHDTCWGTPDAVVIRGSKCTIFDLKMGKGIEVIAKNNLQLMMYALLVSHKYPKIEVFDLVIYQPRIYSFVPDSQPNSWLISTWEIKDFQKVVLNPIMKMPTSHYSFGPKENSCRWCSYKAECPGLSSYISETAQKEFTEKIEREKMVKHVTECFRILPLYDIWKKSVQEKAFEISMEGEQMEGFKLVKSTKWRQFNLDKEELVTLLSSLPIDDIFIKKLLSPNQAENKLKGDMSSLDILRKHIFTPEGSPILVKDTDKRKELSLTAASEFGEYLKNETDNN